MSRVAAGDVIEVKPASDMYTVLVIVAAIAEAIAFIVLFMQANDIFPKGLFG